MYLVARLLTGIATGQTVVAMPIYFAEIASPNSRGLMAGAHGCFINVGYAVSNWVGTFGWRFPNAILVFWALCLLIGTLFIPESPRWLCSRSRHEEALQVLCRLHNQPDDQQGSFAYQELELIQERMLRDRAESDRYGKWQLFTQPTYRKRSILAAMVLAGSQNTGVLVINNYNALLYQSLGLSNAQALLVSAGYNTWGMVCNCIGANVSDRFGRRKLLITGFGMTGIMITVATALIAKYTETQSKTYAAASVVILYLYVACYGSCIDVNVFTLVTEIFPSHLRAQGTGLATALFFLTDILWLQLEPTATGRIGWKYYLVFICLCVVHTVYLYFQLPETSGVALETIDAVFGKETLPSPCDNDREPKSDEERIEIR
ncbi:hypothetical protein N7474_000585 [Penicillium riverlandense]|uniref:uncharacterized protein n=1 Tax=Penicillium riverlandense TaxID=1903569 RepID=UPI002546D312|nr:uncharacterized protein N7474_000585 [Penicillium riverlandense]KAJ5832274.1 hypothetical protein N7474_000585 [Penicillium riverlandense]